MNTRERLHRRRQLWRQAKAGQLPEVEPLSSEPASEAPVTAIADVTPEPRRYWIESEQRAEEHAP